MELSHRRKTALRRAAVWAKYLLPAFCCLFVWISCALPLWRFSNGDGTVRTAQSLFGMVSTVGTSVRATLNSPGAETADTALAKSLRPVPAVFWILMTVTAVFSLLLAFFALNTLPKDPFSRQSNRRKVWFRALFPGRALHMLLPVLSALPLTVPYYIVNRFAKYYAVSGSSQTATGGTTFSYFEYSVTTAGPSPLVFGLILAGLATVLFFAAMPYENSQKMDLYRCYEE